MIQLTIPFRLQSEGNISDHWTMKRKRKLKYQQAVAYSLRTMDKRPDLPCTVKLIRIAPRKLDDDDNLRTAFKAIKDCIADYLIPGLAPGRADGDERIKWEYHQEKGNAKEYAIRIEII